MERERRLLQKDINIEGFSREKSESFLIGDWFILEVWRGMLYNR